MSVGASDAGHRGAGARAHRLQPGRGRATSRSEVDLERPLGVGWSEGFLLGLGWGRCRRRGPGYSRLGCVILGLDRVDQSGRRIFGLGVELGHDRVGRAAVEPDRNVGSLLGRSFDRSDPVAAVGRAGWLLGRRSCGWGRRTGSTGCRRHDTGSRGCVPRPAWSLARPARMCDRGHRIAWWPGPGVTRRGVGRHRGRRIARHRRWVGCHRRYRITGIGRPGRYRCRGRRCCTRRRDGCRRVRVHARHRSGRLHGRRRGARARGARGRRGLRRTGGMTRRASSDPTRGRRGGRARVARRNQQLPVGVVQGWYRERRRALGGRRVDTELRRWSQRSRTGRRRRREQGFRLRRGRIVPMLARSHRAPDFTATLGRCNARTSDRRCRAFSAGSGRRGADLRSGSGSATCFFVESGSHPYARPQNVVLA